MLSSGTSTKTSRCGVFLLIETRRFRSLSQLTITQKLYIKTPEQRNVDRDLLTGSSPGPCVGHFAAREQTKATGELSSARTWGVGLPTSQRGSCSFFSLLPLASMGNKIIVAGAGGSEGSRCNGTYSEHGTLNGKPLFLHENGEARIYFDTYWKMNNEDSTGGWVYGVSDARGPCPPSTWRQDGYSGGNATPCPTLRLLNRNGDATKHGDGNSGGFTGFSSDKIWYCGKKKNQCKCGGCDGVCGPDNGCPCQDCYALIKVFVFCSTSSLCMKV